MKVLIVYDSVYGNTEALAKAIGAALTSDVTVSRAGDVGPSALAGLNLLIVGAPTHSGRPTPSVQAFLDKLPAIQGTPVAVFDTRLVSDMGGMSGYAADKVAASLKEKGGVLVGTPMGFFVLGRKGPLKDGELHRAAGWATSVLEMGK